MKKLFIHIIKEDNFLSLTGNCVIATFGFGGFAILAHTFSMESFSQWVLFIAGGSLVEMLRFGITNTGLIRFLSGADESSRNSLIGSNVLIGIGVTILISSLLLLINYYAYDAIQNSGYILFFNWYPLLAFLNLPWNNAMSILQADRKYGKILILKFINSGGFFLVIILNFYFLKMTIAQLIITLLMVNAVTSLVAILKGWDGLMHIRKAKAATNKKLLSFGKYTTFTLVGTNLLRNSDILIISLSPLGNAAVALYSIPLKLTELQQIPLRSFVATAFPKMSKLSVKGKMEGVKNLFYSYTGALTFLFIFISLITFIFAELFVQLISGDQYLQIDPETGFNVVTLVRVLSIYGLLLPIDRMTGIALDSLNKPHKNALKVFFMVIANVVGDLIAIFVFNSLILVAVSSILFTGVGIWLGMYFLNSYMKLKYIEIFKSGFNFYKNIYCVFKSKRSPNMAN